MINRNYIQLECINKKNIVYIQCKIQLKMKRHHSVAPTATAKLAAASVAHCPPASYK